MFWVDKGTVKTLRPSECSPEFIARKGMKTLIQHRGVRPCGMKVSGKETGTGFFFKGIHPK